MQIFAKLEFSGHHFLHKGVVAFLVDDSQEFDPLANNAFQVLARLLIKMLCPEDFLILSAIGRVHTSTAKYAAPQGTRPVHPGATLR